MTEEEWDEGTHPASMIDEVRDRVSVRMLRNFCAACCRRLGRGDVSDLLEAAADGTDVTDALANIRLSNVPLPIRRNTWGSNPARLPRAYQTAQVVAAVAQDNPRNAAVDVVAASFAQLQTELIGLMQCAFGNPFRRVRFYPKWRTDTAVLLARQMYGSRDFSAMPILADALQDAGCDNNDILSHCRDASQVHARGCWVVDLVLV